VRYAEKLQHVTRFNRSICREEGTMITRMVGVMFNLWNLIKKHASSIVGFFVMLLVVGVIIVIVPYVNATIGNAVNPPQKPDLASFIFNLIGVGIISAGVALVIYYSRGW
jgi:ABC-type multidrug transport system fused ATPase/permease subunit